MLGIYLSFFFGSRIVLALHCDILATWLLEVVVPTEAIANLLGHSSVEITAVYTKVVALHKFAPSEMLNSESKI